MKNRILHLAGFLFVLFTAFALAFPQDFIAPLPDLVAPVPDDFSEGIDENVRIDESAQREFVILVGSESLNLDPHTSNISTESQVLEGLYEGLFSYNPVTLQSECAICEEFKISRDKKTWTFKIRSNALFSNGDKITAQTVKDSWVRLLKNPDASFASLLDVIAGVSDFRSGKCSVEDVAIDVKDELTLTVRLVSQTEYLPNILCHSAFSVVSEKQNVFSGAYVIKEQTKDYVLLEKNKNYWDSENVHLPSIKILLSEDAKENAHLYNNGKVDWAIGAVEVKKINAQQDISISPQFGTEYYFFRPTEEPWNNENLRNALLYAIPWEEIQKDELVPAYSLILPLAGYPEIYGVPEYDLDTAKRLMKESGFEGKELSLKVAIPDIDYYMKQVLILKEAWEKIGVELVIQKTNQNKYLRTIQGWQAQLFTYSWIGDFADPMAFLELFRSGASLNVTGWSDSGYDSLLTEAGNLEGEERLKKLSQAEQYLLDKGMIIPISHTLALNVLDRSIVKGWYDNALNIHPLKYIYLESPKKLPNVASLEF